MKGLLKNSKFRLYCKRIIATTCFLTIIAYVYASATYLFRGKALNVFHDDRISIVGIKQEDSLDMIYVGGSDVFCYWYPLQAWNDYGFTSYDLTSTSMQTENLLYLVRHALKYQDPKLFVIGVRSFVIYSGDGYEGGLRYTSDALDLGIDRLRLIKTYYERRSMDIDIYSIYLDISKHHSRYELLSSPEAWKLMDNVERSPFKGVNVMSSYYYLDQGPQINTGNRREMDPIAEYTLRELLEFCSEKDLNVLFIESPYVLMQEDYEVYNTIGDIVTSYGFEFLNANDYFYEMGLNISEDFSDTGHVNVLGAKKYTDFLGSYIIENYDISNQRAAENISWKNAYADFVGATEEAQTAVENMITTVREGESIAKQLQTVEDLNVWCDLVNDSRFTVLAVGDGTSMDKISKRDRESLEKMGLSHTEDHNLIRILCNSEILYSNENSDENRHETSIGAQSNIPCMIDNENHALSITIEGSECSRKDESGINIVVFQNDYRNIADSLTILCDEGDGIKLLR